MLQNALKLLILEWINYSNIVISLSCGMEIAFAVQETTRESENRLLRRGVPRILHNVRPKLRQRFFNRSRNRWVDWLNKCSLQVILRPGCRAQSEFHVDRSVPSKKINDWRFALRWEAVQLRCNQMALIYNIEYEFTWLGALARSGGRNLNVIMMRD